jgi:hypothetical protein
MRKLWFAVVLLIAGCVVYQPVPTYQPPPPVSYASPPPPPPVGYAPPPPPPPEPAAIEYQPPPPSPVVSVYVEPPVEQPPPIAVPWAPPPMLVEEPPPPPFPEAVWVGGYWVWQGTWVWDYGRWVGPPGPGYWWVHPYYEHRGDVVVFVTGHWGRVGIAFVPPPPTLYIAVERPIPGAFPGRPCIGPEGVFVPPPPGSRLGIIVPAPVGTAPAVVTSAPPVVNVGMRITNNVNSNNTTTINNVTNVTNVTNITHVTIVAPPSATATGQAVNTSVPAQAHLAAALAPAVKVAAPPPASQRPIESFQRGRVPVALPAAQLVHPVVQAMPRPTTQPAAIAHPAAPAAPPAPAAAFPARPEVTPARATPSENLAAPESRGRPEQRDLVREPHPAQAAPMVQPARAANATGPVPKPVQPAAAPKPAQPLAAPKAQQGTQAGAPPHKEGNPPQGGAAAKPKEKEKPNEKNKDHEK